MKKLNIESFTNSEVKELYKEMINETNNEVNICGMTYSPSDVLESVDPIAFRCGLSDYVSEYFVEVDDIYYRIDDYEQAIQE